MPIIGSHPRLTPGVYVLQQYTLKRAVVASGRIEQQQTNEARCRKRNSEWHITAAGGHCNARVSIHSHGDRLAAAAMLTGASCALAV